MSISAKTEFESANTTFEKSILVHTFKTAALTMHNS